jgi:hypothetical protein
VLVRGLFVQSGAYMVNGLVVQVLRWDNLLDDLLQDLLAQFLGGDISTVLSTNNNSVYTERDNSTVVVLVLNSDLGLGIGSQPGKGSITTSSGHLSVEFVCQLKSEWEEFGGLVGSISEHDTLVTSTELLKSLLVVKTLGDIGGLLLNGNHQVEGLVIESLGGIIVTNIFDGIANDLLVIERGLGGDLAKNHDHTSFSGSFTGNFGQRVAAKAGIENSIGDLISDFVWVTFSYRLGLVKVSKGLRGFLRK